MTHQVLIADDHPLFRAALIDSLREMEVEFHISESSTFLETQTHLSKYPTDLLLLDLCMPGNESLLGILRLRSDHPDLAIVVISANDDHEIIKDIFNMGALGYISKSSKRQYIHQALLAVLSGELSFPEYHSNGQDNHLLKKLNQLTPKQLRVLQMIGEGALNKQIAYKLEIKETTVKTHISEILRKLEISNRTQAALILQKLTLSLIHI